MKRIHLFLIAAMVALFTNAAAPNGSKTYYQNANGKKGAALKTALCGIIYDRTEKSYSYLWTAFHTTDVRSDGKIWDMYSNITNYEPGGSAQGHSYSEEGDSYNREHSFPKSWFGGDVAPMYTDLHHMYPTDGFVNSKRSNFPFGETTGNKYKSANDFSKLGTCTVSGYSGTVFEPNDDYKGDFARTYFYMVTCYEEKLPDWYSNNDAGVKATLDGSTYPGMQLWQLNMLLNWAKNDPVSAKETARNIAVAGIQKNRNPFIDYPGLEQYIWGSMKDEAFDYDDYVEPTSYTGYNEGGGSGSGGEGGGTGVGDVADALNVAGWAGYTENSYSSPNTDMTGTSTTTGVSYAMQVFNGSTGTVRGNQSTATSNFSCRNTTTYSGYYIKEVKLTVTGGTIDGSVSGRSVVYFGTSAFTTSPTGTATTSNENASGQTTLTWTNSDTSKNYFILYNLKTSGTATSAVVTVTWGPITADPSFNDLSDVSVNYGSTLTLTQGTTGSPNFLTDGTVTLTSSNEAVVTVDGLTITPVAVGTALIIVNTTATSNYSAASDMFPITVNGPEGKTTAKPTEALTATLDFTNNSWGLPTSSGTTTSNSYTDSQGYTITLAASTAYYFNTSNKYLMLGKSGSTLTLPAFDKAVTQIDVVGNSGASPNVVQNIYVGETAVSTATTGANDVTNTYAIAANYQAAGNIYTLKVTSAHNTQIKSIVIHFAPSASLTATLNSYGYATYCSEYPLDFSGAEDYTAWKIIGVSGTTITFSKITGTIKGGQGILLKGEANQAVTMTSADSENVLSDNLLEGTLAPTYVTTNEYYGLSDESFKKVEEGTVKAGKALLPASVLGGGEVKAFTFIFEDDPDGIDEIQNSKFKIQNEGGQVYDLSGRKIDSSFKKGIYIVNGRKVLF